VIIGISETKLTNSKSAISVPTIPGYNFEFVPTPLASGGVPLFIDDRHSYRILEKASNAAFQALWVGISFVKKKCDCSRENILKRLSVKRIVNG